MRKQFTKQSGKVGLFIILIVMALNLAQAQTGPVFRIGVLDEERGPITDGARLAVNEINAAGGVKGADGTFFRLELIVQPPGDNLATTLPLLRDASIIAVLGPESDDDIKNNIDALQSLNVPVLTPATGDTTLTDATTGRIFRTRAAQIWQGRALANYLLGDLQLQRVATVQLDNDLETSASIVGFTISATGLRVTPQLALQAQTDGTVQDAVQQIIPANPEAVVTYGQPARAGKLLTSLRDAGYGGIFAYNQVDDVAFRDTALRVNLDGIYATTTWPYTASDEASSIFRDNFVRLFGTLPGPIEAASYDAIGLLAAAINRPGELQTNLAQLNNLEGVQGLLRPAQLQSGETSDNVAVVQLGSLGAAQVVARFGVNQRLDINEPIPPTLIPTIAPTATPEGVVITIKQVRQNVRSGPSTSYDILGQLSQNEQARVIGATVDFTWVVIDFRGTLGWLATYLLDVFGDLKTVPIIAPPPTPTPVPTSTPLPVPDIVIIAASAAPSPIIVNQPFLMSVTVRNNGSTNTSQFALASTFPPNNLYASAIIPGLAAGQITTVTLSGTFANTGCYAVVIVADLNNEINEGAGESNNLFNVNYCINKPILRQGSQTLNPGDTIDLEGNAAQGDANWNINASQIDALFTARLGIIPGVTLETVHWDLINPNIVNLTSIPRTSLTPGTVIGILTADGNRGAMRVDDLPGNQLRVTFTLYQN
jgi:ABC-type branched-subunit amino acid transport system substrate-binding protein